MSQIASILKSIKSIWTRVDLIAKDNIYFQRVQTKTTKPYMKISCRVDNVETISLNTDKANLLTYIIDISIWANQYISTADLYSTALETMMNNLTPTTNPLPFVTGFMHCLQGSYGMNLDKDTAMGEDVVLAQGSWKLLTQETR